METKMETKIFDTLIEPVFILDEEGFIIYCNETAALMAEISVRKILRKKILFEEILKFETPVNGLNNLNSILEPTPYQELYFQTESGKSGRVQITIQPFFHNPASWILFFRDVTLEETLQKKYRAELKKKELVINDLEVAKKELENYSQNLEKMVEERTAEITRINRMMAALLDSLGQGFLIFTSNGICTEVASKACQNILECDPRGKYIWDIFKYTREKEVSFQKWMKTIFLELLPFEDLAPLGPNSYQHSKGRNIQLEYYPIRTEGGSIQSVVVVATDITNLVEAREEAESERAHVKMILKLIKNRKEFFLFLRDANSILNQLKNEVFSFNINQGLVFRLFHTLKGGASFFSLSSIELLCHDAETELSRLKNETDPRQFEGLRKMTQLLNNELSSFVTKNDLILGGKEKINQRWIEGPVSLFLDFKDKQLKTQESKDNFMQEFVMEPIINFFRHFNELTENMAEVLGKRLFPIQFLNEELKVFPEIYEPLFSTFVHVFRNTIDHGIEAPQEREMIGKDPAGRIEVQFELMDRNEQKWLTIQVKDDGRGISPERVREKLKLLGKDSESENDRSLINHIFDPDFSTKTDISLYSGRGVGLSSLQEEATKLGGSASVRSSLGNGTTIVVKVPYLLELNKLGSKTTDSSTQGDDKEEQKSA